MDTSTVGAEGAVGGATDRAFFAQCHVLELKRLRTLQAASKTAWNLDPAVREALPHPWMKEAWDRATSQYRLGDTLEERYHPFDIERIKGGAVVGWRSELEKRAAAAGERWGPSMTLASAAAAGV